MSDIENENIVGSAVKRGRGRPKQAYKKNGKNADETGKFSQKKYNELNKERYKIMLSALVPCECGVLVRRDYKTRHLKTSRHLKLLNAKNT